MKALLKIRLRKVMLNPCRNFFVYYINPILLLLIFTMILIFTRGKWSIIRNAHKSMGGHVSNYSIFSMKEIYYSDQFAVICEDNKIADSFIKFLNKTFIPSPYRNYTPFHYKNIDEFVKDEDNRKNNYNVYYLQAVFIIEGTYPNNLTFSLMDSQYSSRKKSYQGSQNMLSFNCYEYGMGKDYIQIFTSYIQEINNIKNQTFIHVQSGEYYRTIYNILSSTKGYSYIVPFFISFMHVFIFLHFLFWMIEEKETKLVRFLNRQGITHYQYILSWYLTFLIMTLLPSFLTAFLLSFCFFFKHFFLLFLFLYLFDLSVFAAALFYHTLIDKVRTASTIMKVLTLCLFAFAYVIIQEGIPLYVKLIFSLFPQVLVVLNMEVLQMIDNFPSITFGLWMTPYYNYSLFTSFMSYIIMIALHLGLALFIMSFRESGLDFIPFVKSLFTKVERHIEDGTVDINEESLIDKNVNHQEISNINQLKKNKNDYLSIRNVTRIYDQLKAVNNFSGEIYGGEIFCLLGHNGAGKTTLINMISGNEDPDKGDIFLGETSLVTNKNFLYRNIGLCSQEDIFFDYLTVNEHLKLMSELKGTKANMLEINDLITRIELIDKKDSLCSTLSGGQKRKFCVALALIGNSKLILLDEPSSGMDPIAKRQLWTFLKRYKSDKIIILTTHSLDEAEYLGDRIGIMSEGVYLCSGTSSYLKSKYPCGYNINCIINSSICTVEKKDELLSQLKEIDSSAQIKIASKAILSVNFLGTGETISKVFSFLDLVKKGYGIESYTVTTTTLEDVFLKINNGANDIFTNEKQGPITQTEINNEVILNINETENSSVNGILNLHNNIEIRDKIEVTFYIQFKAHLRRYFINLWRTKSHFLLELFSAIFLLLFFIFGFSQLLTQNFSSEDYDFNALLKGNPIYYKIDPSLNQTFFESSYFKSLNGTGNFVEYPYEISVDCTADELITNYDKSSVVQNARNIFFFRKSKQYQNGYDIINLYPPGFSEFYLASMNVLISSIFEKEFNINITLNKELTKYPIVSERDNKEIVLTIGGFSVALLGISFLSFSAYIMLEPLKEKVYNVKQMLILSGANLFSYWAAMYIVDIIKFLIFIALIYPFFLFIDVKYSYFFILFVVFAFAMVFTCYCFTFYFSKEEDGQKGFIPMLFAITAAFVIFLVFRFIITERLGLRRDFDLEEYFMTNFIFLETDLFPTSSLLIAIIRVFLLVFESGREEVEYLPKVIINHVIIFIIQAILYCGLLVLLEKKIIGRWKNKFLNKISFSKDNQEQLGLQQGLINQTNYYVQKKQEKITNATKLTVIIHNLKKTYWVCCGKNVRAVNRLYLGLEAKEKFGLLGFNGSGKTTTFQCITNEIFYDEGSIMLHGLDTKSNFNTVRKFIGYCPQENALFSHFNVYDTLFFYSQLKGVKESVEEIANRFGLGKYLKTVSTKLSGGNKRKLIFALALMNNPKMLLLDEPSTGVDPESRRVMWKNINHLEKTNPEYNMILSTHSMEEAEILCDTVSWLKNGNFVCIGNPERLKLQFSAGYHLHIKFNQLENSKPFDNNEIVNELNMIVNNIQLLNNAIMINPNIVSYYDLLYKALLLIKDNCDSIVLKQIGDDMSFELIIKISLGKEGEIFYTVLNMKNMNENLSEINISMESLENILTSCENGYSVL